MSAFKRVVPGEFGTRADPPPPALILREVKPPAAGEEDVVARTRNGIKVLAQLKRDRQALNDRVQQLALLYNDNNLQENVTHIQHILEHAMHRVIQVAELGSRPLWKDTMDQLRESIHAYQNYLKTCSARLEMQEASECLKRIDSLLQCGDGDLLCCICQETRVDVSIQCGHVMCAECTQRLDRCPLCRQPFEATDIRPLFL